MCTDCCKDFQSDEALQQHKTYRDGCVPSCISSQCYTSSTLESVQCPLSRRHIRARTCPPVSRVSVQDRWQFLYRLKYPDRDIKSPSMTSVGLHAVRTDLFADITFGNSHPHGTGRLRGPRRNTRHPPDTELLEQRLAQARAEHRASIQKQELENQIHHLREEQQEQRFNRMVDIITECVSELQKSGSALSPLLLRMINNDAPQALQVIEPDPDSQTHNLSGESGQGDDNFEDNAFTQLEDDRWDLGMLFNETYG